jgi:mutator protein MutT
MDVVAAVIRREGRILICQRNRFGNFPLKWEFPGGKVEPGEDGPTALARELQEELQIEARIGKELHRQTVEYPSRSHIHLFFYEVTHFKGDPVNMDFAEMVWETPGNLPGYDFLEGDVDLVKKLAAG